MALGDLLSSGFEVAYGGAGSGFVIVDVVVVVGDIVFVWRGYVVFVAVVVVADCVGD